MLALVLAAVALSACGDGSETGGAAESDAADIGLESRPGASDTAAGDADVQAAIEGLLAAHDRVVNQIVADPGVAADPADPLVQEYTALFEPDSEVAAGAVAAWADQGAAGRATRPASTDHPAFSSRLDGEVEVMADGEVRFPTCGEQRYAVVDADGAPLEVQPFAEVPGEGTAVLVDGDWRLRRLDVWAVTGCGEGGP